LIFYPTLTRNTLSLDSLFKRKIKKKELPEKLIRIGGNEGILERDKLIMIIHQDCIISQRYYTKLYLNINGKNMKVL
jgi:hypothetical protein